MQGMMTLIRVLPPRTLRRDRELARKAAEERRGCDARDERERAARSGVR